MEVFKAGDFTHGRMAEIFKECFFNDLAVINHKQFGRSYLIPENVVRLMVIELLMRQAEFNAHIAAHAEIKDLDQVADVFASFNVSEQQQCVEVFLGEPFYSWFEVLLML